MLLNHQLIFKAMSKSENASASASATDATGGRNPFRQMSSDLDARYTPGEAIVQIGLPILGVLASFERVWRTLG